MDSFILFKCRWFDDGYMLMRYSLSKIADHKSDKWAGMENQESSANTEVPFDVEKITADDINMEDISTQSSDMTEKASGMNKSQITNLALNLLSTDSHIRSAGIYILGMKPCILCKQKLISHPDEPIKEFTMATCGCLYHQKCLEGYLLNIAKNRSNPTCPDWDCKGREIETLITQDLFKEMDKPTTLTAEDTASKQVYLENATPVSEDANEIYMNQLGLFSEEEQSSSKATDKASSSIQIIKETSDQATSPIEVVSTTPGNSENLDDSISKDSNG
ncbi:hypothetical protein RclHR1_08350015 [Rhizophagus clarus]|uniref:RING-type domain-containing protein n=2 Tax=Rhizophagus clarus TaxID=94130 RepID=A0A2Z6SBP0_9GLOM|nr:hypothetical protein RclHR1_08350015 [Rhizophagus clarus]